LRRRTRAETRSIALADALAAEGDRRILWLPVFLAAASRFISR
jgi:hypothetical protein